MFKFASHRGFLLVFDGADNVGKGVVMEGVVSWMDNDWLPAKKKECILTGVGIRTGSEPDEKFRDEIGAVPVDNWLRQLYLFIRQREMIHSRYGWLYDAIEANHHIAVKDRSYHTTCVYQGILSGITNREILMSHGPWLFKPDLTVIVTSTLDTIKKRITNGSKDSGFYDDLDRDMDLQKKVRQRYRDMVDEPNFSECVLLDNDGPLSVTICRAIEIVESALEEWVKVFRTFMLDS